MVVGSVIVVDAGRAVEVASFVLPQAVRRNIIAGTSDKDSHLNLYMAL
jgi:hypothetical protein